MIYGRSQHVSSTFGCSLPACSRSYAPFSRAFFKAIAIAVIASFLALIAFSSSPQPACAAEPAHKVVMIGDSYSMKSTKYEVKVPWPERVCKLMGIRAADCKVYHHLGYGFARTKNRRFLQLLKNVKRDASVTDVLIVGGAGNDRWSSVPRIKRYYVRTMKRIKYLYPNATIMHGIINWHEKSDFYQRTMKRRYSLYRALAKKCDVTYLRGCESVLYGKMSYLSFDYHHANDRGQRAIAARVVKSIKKYNPSFGKPKTVNTLSKRSDKLAAG